jgi:hypothetical protein
MGPPLVDALWQADDRLLLARIVNGTSRSVLEQRDTDGQVLGSVPHPGKVRRLLRWGDEIVVVTWEGPGRSVPGFDFY